MTTLRLATRDYQRACNGPSNTASRRVLVHMSADAPVCRVEVEVFDALIGQFELLAANDNDPPHPVICRGRDPPRSRTDPNIHEAKD